MVDSWKAVRVGLLVVVVGIASYVTYRLVDETAGNGDEYTVWAVFDDVQGLVEKSRVLVAGIQVGYIQKIRLWGSRARVDIRIHGNVKLHSDAYVMRRSASILGETILVVVPGSADQERLKNGDQIAALKGASDTSDIIANVADISDSIRKVSHQLEHAFGGDEAGQQMSSALRNLTEALEAANRTISENEHAIGNTLKNVESITEDAAPKLARILNNIDLVTKDVSNYVKENGEGDKAGGIGDTLATINRASHELESVLKDVEEVSDRTARGEGTIGRLTSDETLIDEVEGVVNDVGDFVGGISRLQTIVSLRSEYNFLANTFKSYVQLRLQPREDRYYLFELIDDPRGLTQFSQTTVRTSPPLDGEPSNYTQTQVTTRDAFRFSLMFAKRIHFATFRFGILESTGGVSVLFHLLDDRLEMTNDLFAFGEQAMPRLRTRIAMEVVNRFWILGGLDDYLNDTRDMFFGAQLRFNDEDLKNILPFAGGVPAR
ncbi:MAG: MCE family protein [Myxococcales bacterium]|nr:MAG: MCE family protein [Myxococcales bacterium]